MQKAGGQHERAPMTHAAPHQRDDRERAKAERQLARVEVALERVGAGPGDRMAQCQRSDERRRTVQGVR